MGPARPDPKPATPPLPARYYALLCERLQELRVDVPSVLRAAGIAPASIRRHNATLSLPRLEALLREAHARSGRDDLGFELGPLVKFSTHDILGYGMVSSATFDHALRLAARYFRLISPLFAVDYRRGERHVEVGFRPALSFSPLTMRFHFETIVSALHGQMAAMIGPRFRAYDVHLFGPVPRHRRYRELAPARVHFDSAALPGMRIVLDADMVDAPMAFADPRALAMAEARCAELLRNASATGSVSDWVSMMLREARGGLPSLTDLARMLHVGPHTLERRLRAEGRRFIDLSTQVRHERARELLRGGELTITQIAYELGYRDVSNFTRAFRRDSGHSPTEFAGRSAGPSAAASPSNRRRRARRTG